MPRLFVAILPPPPLPPTLAKLAAELRRRLNQLKASWVAAEQFHVNLHFLNEVAEEKINLTKNVITQVAAQHQPLTITVSRLLGFPSLRQARVLSLGIQDSPKLTALALDIQSQLQRAGVAAADTKNYRPHVTLARIKNQLSAGAAQTLAEFTYRPLSWPVSDCALIHSQLTAAGPVYKILQTFTLTGSKNAINKNAAGPAVT